MLDIPNIGVYGYISLLHLYKGLHIMTTYTITYDTEFGEAHYEGDEGQHYQAFIASATKAGIKMGLIEQGDSVLDYDHEVESF